MKCNKCGTEMIKANLTTGILQVYLLNKKKGAFEAEKRSSVSCFVCPKCGYIELYADRPKDIVVE